MENLAKVLPLLVLAGMAATAAEHTQPVDLIALSACFTASSGDRDELAAVKAFRGLSEKRSSFKIELFPEPASDARCDVTVKLVRSADGITADVSSAKSGKPLFDEHQDAFTEKSLAGLYRAVGARFHKDPGLAKGLAAEKEALDKGEPETVPAEKPEDADDAPVWTPKRQTKQSGAWGGKKARGGASDDSDDSDESSDDGDSPARGMMKAMKGR